MANIFKRNKKTLAAVFHHIYYKTDWWKAKDTLSGPGSTLEHTKNIREALPALFTLLHITSLIDAPCGDLNWMSHVPLGNIQYTGIDIVEKLIRQNKKKFPDKNFIEADITKDPLPYADLVLCRDCFIHLPNELVTAAIQNFKKTGIRYLLTNSYNFIAENKDVAPGQFRMLNLLLPPFSLPAPLQLIEEEFTSGYPDKQLGLWLL